VSKLQGGSSLAKLVYSAIVSLDGFTADESGNFDWSMPDEEVHAFVNDLERPIGTYLYGRKMYEVMQYWQAVPNLAEEPDVIRDYAAIWKSASKVVYSRTLTQPATPQTQIVNEFDPQAVWQMKENLPQDISIGGPTLAAEALRAGLVDVCAFFVSPVIVGGGTAALPAGLRLDLELVQECRFGNGVVYLSYDVKAPSP
jgi:dihydrofolate reductase